MPKVVMLIHEENGRYGASFPDFPGCTAVAEDPDRLIDKAVEVLAWHVAGMVEDGVEVRRPRSLGELWQDPDFRTDRADAAYATQVDLDLPGKTVRINITAEESALDRIDQAAKAAGESRSAYLIKAALERARRRLSPPSPVKEKRHSPGARRKGSATRASSRRPQP
jgi:predicted RNase H-like HicB family nuclease